MTIKQGEGETIKHLFLNILKTTNSPKPLIFTKNDHTPQKHDSNNKN